MQAYDFRPGRSPLLLSIPHAGTYVPGDIANALTETAARLPDTDWHVDRLYAFAQDLGAHLIRANYSRLCVDLNRPPDDAPLYAGATTGLFPDVLFDGRPVFHGAAPPDRRRFLETVWYPYHARIRTTLDALKAEHGHAVLFDAHSIRSVIPRLFEGILPDFNIGTNDARSLTPGLEARLSEVCRACESFTTVVNGRFKGGYTTRHYGDPANGIHAVQLELAQKTYMDEFHPFAYRPEDAARVQAVLKPFVETLIGWRPRRR